MKQTNEFEKKIRPAIEAFAADLQGLVFKLVEETILHGSGSPRQDKPKPRKKAAQSLKPTVIDCGGSVAFSKVAREVVTGPMRDWNSRVLAKRLKLGETTVRGYLKELHALGVVDRNEAVKGEKRVTYTRKNRLRITLKR